MKYNFDREWKFSLGKYDITPESLEHGDVYGFAKAGGIAGAAALGFNDACWQAVTLPHDWQHNQEFDRTASADHGYRKGMRGWYRKTFCLDESDKNCALSIVFDGIAGISDLYLNGCKINHNESRYNSFCVDITDIANYGTAPNILAVEVDCSIWEGWWYEGSGIYRHVWLMKEPFVHPSYNGIVVRTRQGKDGFTTNVEVQLENASSTEQSYQCSVQICDCDGNPLNDKQSTEKGRIKPFSKQRHSWEMAAFSPILWDIDHPYLYKCKVHMKCDDMENETVICYGYRTIEVNADIGFLLNGKAVKLLGTCNHQDHAGIGAALPDEVQRYRLEVLKEMGCNAYRCAHHNPTPELLDLCDELGILVMDENRAFNTSETGMNLLRSMVRRDRNHPCVVFYSLFNEEPLQGTAKGRKMAARMIAAVKELDPDIPVLGSFNGGYMEEDGAATLFDVTGINYFSDSYDAFHEKYPDQPVVSSELVSAFSTREICQNLEEDHVFHNYDENAAPWGESVRMANQAVLTRDFVMGMFVWTGFDYRGEPSPYEWPSVSSHFGAIDTCGFPKDSYYLYQAYWKKETILHILPHWNHTEGTVVRVMTYSNCDEVELFLNGRSMGRQKNEIYKQCTWEVKYEPGEIHAIGFQNGIQAAEAHRKTAGKAVAMHVATNHDSVNYSTRDALILDVSAVDEHGIVQPLEEVEIEIIPDGAILLGTGNGNPNSHDKENINRVKLFRGRCQIILQAMDKEFMTVRLTSDKLGEYSGKWFIGKSGNEKEILSAETKIIGGWRMSHTASKVKPEAGKKMSKTDMNTLEPVEFEGKTQSQLDGKAGWYCLYQTEDLLPSDAGKTLCLSKVAGDIEIYVGTECMVKKSCDLPQEVAVIIPPSVSQDHTLSVIVKNSSIDLKAGIMEPVILVP